MSFKNKLNIQSAIKRQAILLSIVTYLALLYFGIHYLSNGTMWTAMIGCILSFGLLFLSIYFDFERDSENELVIPFKLLLMAILLYLFLGGWVRGLDAIKEKEDLRIVSSQEINNVLQGCPEVKLELRDSSRLGGVAITQWRLNEIGKECKKEANKIQQKEILDGQLKGVK